MIQTIIQNDSIEIQTFIFNINVQDKTFGKY